MFDLTGYYLNRVPPFMWLCIIGIFFHSLIKARKKYLCGDISFFEAAARTLLSPYVLFLLALTVFTRLPDNEISFELIPFLSYREAFKSGDKALIFQYIGNIMIFIPFGLLLPSCRYSFKGRKAGIKETLIFGVFLSLFIEIFQLVTRFGTFETDDIINNFVGVIIGSVIFSIIKAFTKLFKKDDKI